MKSKQILFKLVTALAVAALIFNVLPAFPAAAATQTIGGTAVSGNLRIAVMDDGTMTVEQYTGSAWLHNIYPLAAGNSKGSTLCINGTRYNIGGLGTWTPGAGGVAATIVSNTGGAVGTGTIVTTWDAGGTRIVQTTSYTDGNQYYTMSWAITNNTLGDLSNLRLFHGQDTLLAGSDRGGGWWNPTLAGTQGAIGVNHPSNGQSMWLQAMSEAPFNYTSQNYSTARGEVNACALSGTVDPAITTDNGYALEFRRGTLTAASIWTVTVEEHFVLATPVSITGISPNQGPTTGGTLVTITGTSLTGGTFTFDGIAAACTVNVGGASATCTTPAHAAGPVDVRVTTAGGPAVLAGGFTYMAPVVPNTGFAPNRVTALPEQTVAYTASDLWLEIPKLGVQMDIVGVPSTNGEWDVSWLGSNAGWLQGSAFPTWAGNSVITGHVWNADNTAGPFIYINTLWYGDQVIVHAWGADYVYEVRSVQQVGSGNTAAMLKHEDLPWVTLVTCRGFDPVTGDYKYRVLVRAVLVEVK